MNQGNIWVSFFREQYPEKSRIRLRTLETPTDKLPPKSMGTLEYIDDNCGFHVKWDNGMSSVVYPNKDSFRVLEPELNTMKLYMPLSAERINSEYDDYEDEFEPLSQSEICQHQDAIIGAMLKYRSPEEAERGIMHWYGEDDTVDQKVRSVVFTAEERNGKLWGIAECRVAGVLTAEEMETLKDYISGQASDGWGEGFEQREISTGEDEIYVHLWNFKNWSIQTEEERFGPKLADGLPSLCFSTLKSTGELICIQRGESGYYPSDWSTNDPVQNRKLADYNNQRLGVTAAQRQAMEVGSMVGWNVPGANPAAYENNGGHMGQSHHSKETGIRTTLQEKLDADYALYSAQWQRAYEISQGDLPLETLEEMAVVNTVYGNLQNLAASYPMDYMAALTEESHPLHRMAEQYRKAGIFAIEPQVNDMLCAISDYDGDLNQFGEVDTTCVVAHYHAERMALLDQNLDRKILDYNGSALQSMGYHTVRERAVEIFTQRQLYQSLRFEKDQYPAEKLDVLATFKNPLNLNGVPIVGERNLCQRTMDEIQELFPKMYPDIIPVSNLCNGDTLQDLQDSSENLSLENSIGAMCL